MGQKLKIGYVAMNKGEFDLENMSFFNSKETPERAFGDSQEIVEVQVIFVNV